MARYYGTNDDSDEDGGSEGDEEWFSSEDDDGPNPPYGSDNPNNASPSSESSSEDERSGEDIERLKTAYISHHTKGQQDYKLAQAWIKECLESHPQCQKPSEGTLLPTRLIDVGLGSETREPRLVLTTSIKQPLFYSTLSHCWGLPTAETHAAMSTTRYSLHTRLEGIPLATLPQSFKDAVTVTRNLGIPYLWIDSLCIIQKPHSEAGDSVALEDWECESAKMGSIYHSATCCLIATSSGDSHGGFFVRAVDLPPKLDKDKRYDPYDLPNPPRPVNSKVWDRCFKTEQDFALTLNTMVDSGPVSLRGWCLQERHLSPRNLHYTKYGTVWECSAGLRFDQKLQSGASPNPRNLKGESGEDEPSDRSFHRVLRDWNRIVENYTARSLTNALDRLPAISGLVQEVQKATGAEYCAGSWRNHQHRDLCWRVLRDETNTPPRRLREYSAPSWSWGSILGPVKFQETALLTDNFVARIDALELSVGKNNQFGTVLDGFIMISGLISRIEVMWEGNYVQINGAGGKAEHICTLHVDDLAELPDGKSRALHAIVLWTFSGNVVGGGLALLPVKGEKNVYHRVGYLQWTLEDHDDYEYLLKGKRKLIKII